MTENYRLPENAEASIVGCLLLCPDTKAAVSRLVSEGNFASPVYGAMFSAAMELEEPDSVAFRESVKQRGYTLPDGFFAALGDIAVSRHNVELYAWLLREDSQKRQLRELGQQLQESTGEAAEIITTATSRLQEIERGSIASDIAAPDDSFRAFWEHRKMVESGAGAVPTGFAPLDAILGGGMLRSGLYILAARPGMGKTTAALQFADSIAATVGPVLFVSLEMSLEQIEGKRIARMSGIPSDEILLGNGKNLDYRTIRSAAEQLKKLPLHISRRPAATVAQIRRMAKQIENLQCVVVDYLGKITPSNSRASRYEQVTGISQDLKTLAVELGVPVLCLAQLNRENTSRNDKRPQLSDLRDSGAIEQDADGVIMLHREDYYTADEAPLKPWESVALEIIVRKNRHGRSFGICSAGFFPATGKIIREVSG
ncbi:MAG: AAA family ATPase [Oscillibacter sp.]|nr:AAA family ATPase [Oscillibacter sp.]